MLPQKGKTEMNIFKKIERNLVLHSPHSVGTGMLKICRGTRILDPSECLCDTWIEEPCFIKHDETDFPFTIFATYDLLVMLFIIEFTIYNVMFSCRENASFHLITFHIPEWLNWHLLHSLCLAQVPSLYSAVLYLINQKGETSTWYHKQQYIIF